MHADNHVITGLVNKSRTVLLDMPQLYLYLFHGKNTCDSDHWEEMLGEAEEVRTDTDYEAAMSLVAERYPHVKLQNEAPKK